jgi:hypothetical protein
MTTRRNQTLVVGAISLLVVVLTMAIDHLFGNESGDQDDDQFPVDPAMFAISVGLSLVLAVVLLGWLVPRQRSAGPERAARSGLICSVLSVVPGITLVWVGVPFVVAGAGVALGLEGRAGSRRREATAAVVIGALALTLGTAGYLVVGLR